MKKKIKIKYMDSDLPKLEKISAGDWIDLRVADTLELKAGNTYKLPLGVAMKLPKGYEALVIPRSSTFFKYGLIQGNSVGLIDNTYCGDKDEWCYPVYAMRDITITKGTRICQFRLFKNQDTIRFYEVRNLAHISRGGFGSTGER